MKTIAHILETKDRVIHTTTPATSVYDAIKLMADKHIGALPVLEDGEVIGMVTERDYARKIVLMDLSSRKTSVRDIMTSPVLYVRPDQTIEEAMTLMTGIRSRHLPVLDNGKLTGLISIGDLVKSIILEQKAIIQQLESHLGKPGRNN